MKKSILVAITSVGFTLSGAYGLAEPVTNTELVSANLAGHPLQQVAITTKNLPKAKDFYRNQLGLPFLFESNGMAFFDIAGVRLMVALDAERPETRPTSILYFEVDDFHAAVGRLIAANVDLDGPIETVQQSAAGELKIQQFKDLDGNALGLIGFVRTN